MGLDMSAAVVRCDGCGEEVDPRAAGTFREVTGWVQARKGGGAHAIKGQKPTGRFACRWCAERQFDHLAHGAPRLDQPGLL
jgi:hypothetical protein